METANNSKDKRTFKLERVFGIILLIPPILCVFLFLINLIFGNDGGDITGLDNLSENWTGSYFEGRGLGRYSRDGVTFPGSGGFTSSAPIYLGLMAIAGALLLKGTDRK
jgi:hypothetical protein